MTVHGLVLAGGASTRMGRPKALLTLDGETFVSHLAGLLRGSGCVSVAVVMGAHADEIEPRLPPAVHGVRHEGWAAGMRSSLRAGVAALAPGHILLTHVDRPVVAPNRDVVGVQGDVTGRRTPRDSLSSRATGTPRSPAGLPAVAPTRTR